MRERREERVLMMSIIVTDSQGCIERELYQLIDVVGSE
jgi:hypothetical protein